MKAQTEGVAMATKLLHLSTPFILFDKCTKFYLILTSDV